MSATFGNERQSMAGYEIGSGGFFIQVIVSMLTLALVGISRLQRLASSRLR